MSAATEGPAESSNNSVSDGGGGCRSTNDDASRPATHLEQAELYQQRTWSSSQVVVGNFSDVWLY